MDTCKPEQEGEDMVAKRKSEKDKSEKEMTVCPLPPSYFLFFFEAWTACTER